MKIKNTELKIIKADITQLKVDAIVDVVDIGKGSLKIGEAIEAPAENLKAKYVIHAIALDTEGKTDELKIRSACANSLKLAQKLKLKSIAFPALGCGVGGYPAKAAAKIMAQEVLKHAKYDSAPLEGIIFALNDDETFKEFEKIALSYLEYIEHKLSQGPFITVDIIIEVSAGVVLIERSNPPFGWAIPGGFVDYGESLEECAMREAKEETDLDIYDLEQMHTYSKPYRDPRFHTITTVFVAKAKGKPKAGDDAQNLKVVTLEEAQKLKLVFDHQDVLADYERFKKQR